MPRPPLIAISCSTFLVLILQKCPGLNQVLEYQIIGFSDCSGEQSVREISYTVNMKYTIVPSNFPLSVAGVRAQTTDSVEGQSLSLLVLGRLTVPRV